MAISPGSTLIDYVIPAQPSKRLNVLRDFTLVICFSALIAVTSFLEIHLSFTPVPITLQTFFVLLTGAALGSKRGGLAMLAYLAEGAAGLPVFAGGHSGLVILLGPTGGYLWSFPIVAFVVGWLCERGLDRSFWTSAFAMLPGTAINYLMGVTWLAILTHISFMQAIVGGMLPFIPGDLFKLVLAALLLHSAWTLIRAWRPDQP